MGGWVGGPCAGAVGGGRGVEVAVGVKVGVLVGVGGKGVAVGGSGVGVGKAVTVGVGVGSGIAVDRPSAAEGVGVEGATKATTSRVGSTSLSNMATRTPATKARAGNSNQPLPIARLSLSFNSTGL